ncbi:hypothetical protein THAOC_17808, partial [Thalassiosira oceanica]
MNRARQKRPPSGYSPPLRSFPLAAEESEDESAPVPSAARRPSADRPALRLPGPLHPGPRSGSIRKSQGVQLEQRARLDLPYPTLVHAELAADLRYAPRRAPVVQAEPQSDDRLLPRAERLDEPPHVLAEAPLGRHVGRRRSRVPDEGVHRRPVGPPGPRRHAPLPPPGVDGAVEGADLVGAVPVEVETGHGHPALLGELLVVRPPSQLGHEDPLLYPDVVDLPQRALGDAYRPGLLVDVPPHLLLDPPRRVRAEPEAEVRVELLRGAGQADDALLARVLELHGRGPPGGRRRRRRPFLGRLSCHRDDEAEVGLDERGLGPVRPAYLLLEGRDGVVRRLGPLGE